MSLFVKILFFPDETPLQKIKFYKTIFFSYTSLFMFNLFTPYLRCHLIQNE